MLAADTSRHKQPGTVPEFLKEQRKTTASLYIHFAHSSMIGYEMYASQPCLCNQEIL